jgi:hypothetical protein
VVLGTLLTFTLVLIKAIRDIKKANPGAIFLQAGLQAMGQRFFDLTLGKQQPIPPEVSANRHLYALSMVEENKIVSSCENYVKMRGHLPASLADLSKAGLGPEFQRDPWSRPYRLRILRANLVMVQTTGPSGVDRVSEQWADSAGVPAIQLVGDNLVTLSQLNSIGPTSKDWKTFRSTKGQFAFRSSPDWHILEDSSHTFEIINFSRSQMLKGVGLSKGGASITVLKASANINTTEEWLKKDEIRFVAKNQRLVDPNIFTQSACRRVTEVQWKSEVGPNTFTDQTSLYCQTDKRLFRIELSNWSDDPKEPELQQTVLSIAASFKCR